MVAELKIISQTDIGEAVISHRDDDIVEVVFKDGVEINVELQHKLIKAYLELFKNNKKCFLFRAMDDVTITKEARSNSITLEGISPVKASAVLTTSIAYKIIGQFYLKVNKPTRPFNIFKTESEAIAWLKKHQ